MPSLQPDMQRLAGTPCRFLPFKAVGQASGPGSTHSRRLVIVASKTVVHRRQVVLTQDVGGLGKAGDVCWATAGHIRNHLFPRRLAEPASEEVMGRMREAQAEKERAEAEAVARARQIATALATIGKFTMHRRLTASGGLFGEPTAKEVATLLQEGTGHEFDEKSIVLPPMRRPGNYSVAVKLHTGVQANFTLLVQKLQD